MGGVRAFPVGPLPCPNEAFRPAICKGSYVNSGRWIARDDFAQRRIAYHSSPRVSCSQPCGSPHSAPPTRPASRTRRTKSDEQNLAIERSAFYICSFRRRARHVQVRRSGSARLPLSSSGRRERRASRGRGPRRLRITSGVGMTAALPPQPSDARVARLERFGREQRVVDTLNRGVPVGDIAARFDVGERVIAMNRRPSSSSQGATPRNRNAPQPAGKSRFGSRDGDGLPFERGTGDEVEASLAP